MDVLDTTREITKLIKYSPRRDRIFEHLRGIRVLCPTRWTGRADSLGSIISNYHTLQNTWDE